MQAVQFQTTSENGFIRIPDEYRKLVGLNVKVIVVNEEQPDTGLDDLFPPVIDTKGWRFDRDEANERYATNA